jgi:hypothetical protein
MEYGVGQGGILEIGRYVVQGEEHNRVHDDEHITV